MAKSKELREGGLDGAGPGLPQLPAGAEGWGWFADLEDRLGKTWQAWDPEALPALALMLRAGQEGKALSSFSGERSTSLFPYPLWVPFPQCLGQQPGTAGL